MCLGAAVAFGQVRGAGDNRQAGIVVTDDAICRCGAELCAGRRRAQGDAEAFIELLMKVTVDRYGNDLAGLAGGEVDGAGG